MREGITIYTIRVGPPEDNAMVVDHDRDLVLETVMCLFGDPAILQGSQINALAVSDRGGMDQIDQAVLDQLKAMRLVHERMSPVGFAELGFHLVDTLDRLGDVPLVEETRAPFADEEVLKLSERFGLEITLRNLLDHGQRSWGAIMQARMFIRSQVDDLRRFMLKEHLTRGNILVLADTPVAEMFMPTWQQLLSVGEAVETRFPFEPIENDHYPDSNVWRLEDLKGNHDE